MHPGIAPHLPPTPILAMHAGVVASINHLLAQESWARQQLALHRSKQVCIDAGVAALYLCVGPDGLVEAGSAQTSSDVTIRVRLVDLPLMAANRERAFSYVKIEGDADLANTVSQLARSLRWDAEHDLEPWIGPIAATRLVAGTLYAVQATGNAGRRLCENVAEFLLDEQPQLVRPSALDGYADEVARARDDVERCAKRIAKLEQVLARRAGDGSATARDAT